MPDYCYITTDKETGKEVLIPHCYSVINWMHLDMSDRALIKGYCSCDRPRREKYQTKTRDEVLDMIKQLEEQMQKHLERFDKMKEQVEFLKEEVYVVVEPPASNATKQSDTETKSVRAKS